MSKYMVEDTELTSIADAIREKKGLNMYDPVRNIAFIRPGVDYVFSKYITFDGNTNIINFYTIYNAEGQAIASPMMGWTPTPSAGAIRRFSYPFTAPENAVYLVTKPITNCPETDIQLETGSSATTYNAYQKIEFPDGFVDGIYEIGVAT